MFADNMDKHFFNVLTETEDLTLSQLSDVMELPVFQSQS